MRNAWLLPVSGDDVSPELGSPKPERILVGEPKHRTWNVEDDGEGTYAGLWESTPGEWRIEYDEWEFCHIVSGEGTVTHDDGTTLRYGPGDAFVLRPGFRGTWRVDLTTRKHYVIRT